MEQGLRRLWGKIWRGAKLSFVWKERIIEPLATWIEGIPATFSTAREKAWKANLIAQIPLPSIGDAESGISMQFYLPSLAPQKQPLDVDNLAEPVFSILIGRVGWFGRSRPRIRWWSATKSIGETHGCSLIISSDTSPPLPTAAPTYDELYTGVLPKNATAPEVAKWATTIVDRAPRPDPSTLTLFLGFGSPSVNIGDISTGVVKSFIDCLYPFFGGYPGRPEDFRISHLIVYKAVPDLTPDTVRVILWYHNINGMARVSSNVKTQIPLPEISGMNNPCRRGSAKWIVCDAALCRMTIAEVQAKLEQLKPGSGIRLKEYLSDLRSENKLDVGSDGVRLYCNGMLRK